MWAKNKEWYGNSPRFWAKGESGYTSCIEDCEFYDTYEQAAQRCDGNDYPVLVEDLIPYTKLCIVGGQSVLTKARERYEHTCG